ncbi:phage tail length tape measure family protein [Ensifer canadensis]
MVEKTDDLVISISTDLATVKRSLKRLEQDISSTTGKVQKQFNSLGKGVDNSMTSAMQARVDKMVGIGTKGAKEWSGALADQGKELERLRSKYSPLFATINNYKSAVSDIRRAHAVGAISANEMTAAIQRERQAALASTAAIRDRNRALKDTPAGRGGQGFQTANIAAQFQDIAVTSAMGMNPLQIALQQGTQLSSVLNTMGSGKQVISGLAGAFTSLISPVSLVTIGLIAGGAAAIQYFSALEWGGGKSEETLKKEAELVQAVATKWGDALPALKAYNDERERVAGDKELSEALKIGASAQWDDLREKLGDVNITITDIVSRISQMGEDTGEITKLQSTFSDLTKGIDEGNASVDLARQAHKQLADLVKTSATPELEAYLKIFQELIPAIEGASDRAKKFDRDAAIALTSRYPSQGAYGGMQNADGTIQGGGTVLPDNGPVPGSRPLIELDGLPGAQETTKKAETAAQKAANAYRDLIKSADDRIAQLRLESEITGEYGVATDAARFRLELLQQAEDKGRSLSEAQRAQIEQKVAAYEKYSQELSEAKLKQDLLDDAVFAGMSKQEQAVKLRLRSYGLSEDMGGQNAAMIRDRFQREELSDLTQSFLSEFSSGILTGGKSIGESFADAVKNAAANAMQKSLDSLFEQIGGALASAVFGAKGGGATGSVASVASSFAAPVGAVTSGALPAVGKLGSYAKAIQAIESGGNYGALGPITRSGDRAYGAYQMMGNNIGPWSEAALGQRLSPQQFLGDKSAQDAIFNHRFGGYAGKYGASGAAQAWFGGPGSVGKGGMGADILGTTGNEYVKKFNSQLAKMGETAESAVGGLGKLDSGLNAITQNFGAGKGLGGIAGGFDWGSLFSPSWKPNTTLSNVINGVPGFAKGTNFAPGGLAIVGENGPELVNLPRGSQVTPNHRLNAPRAPRLNGRSSLANSNAQPGILQVLVSGASGDDHVRTLVKQGVGEALAAQNKNMERGGFGTMQARYGNQKG